VYDKFFYRYRVCSKDTWPSYKGSFQEGTEALLRSLNIDQAQYRKGATKIFIRAPETVFNLEELRERKVITYANKIQRFFQRFTMVSYYYNLQKDANDRLRGNKERRRLSIDRPFGGDYVNYRENFGLKAVVASHDKNEKVHFSHVVNKYDRRFRAQRRVLLLTDAAVYVVAVEKNKDKDDKAKKPWLYVVKRRLLLSQLQGIEFSKFADNFLVLKASEYNTLLECRRKTEFLGTLLKHSRNVPIYFINLMDLTLKGNKKGKPITFEKGQLPKEETRMKSGKVVVGDGLSADTVSNIRPPEALPVHQLQKEIIPRNNNNAAAPSQPSAPSLKPSFKKPAAATYQSKPAPSSQASLQPAASSYIASSSAPSHVASPAHASAPVPAANMKRPLPPAQPAQEKVKALYDFDAESKDELTFREGDIITVLAKDDANWWDGQLSSGSRGKFPTNYVEVIRAPAAKPAPKPAPAKIVANPSAPPSAGRGAAFKQSPSNANLGRGAAKPMGAGAKPAFAGRGRG